MFPSMPNWIMRTSCVELNKSPSHLKPCNPAILHETADGLSCFWLRAIPQYCFPVLNCRVVTHQLFCRIQMFSFKSVLLLWRNGIFPLCSNGNILLVGKSCFAYTSLQLPVHPDAWLQVSVWSPERQLVRSSTILNSL